MQAFTRSSRSALQAVARRQAYSTSTSAYASTANNLRINKDTKVIFQGFTGKQGTYVAFIDEPLKLMMEADLNRLGSMRNKPSNTVCLHFEKATL